VVQVHPPVPRCYGHADNLPPKRTFAPVFITLLFPYFLGNFFRPFLAVVAGDLSRELGLDAAGLATTQATFLLAFAFTQVPVALSLDRFGPRRILILSLCAAVAGGVLLSVSGQPWQALIAMALLGAGFLAGNDGWLLYHRPRLSSRSDLRACLRCSSDWARSATRVSGAPV